MIRSVERQPTKKRFNPSKFSISKKFVVKDSFKIFNKKKFDKDLSLLIIKNNLLIQYVESIWLKRLTLHLCPILNFPSRRQFSQKNLPNLVEKINQMYVVPSFTKSYTTITRFDDE